MIDENIRARFATRIEPGEDILWVGRPTQGIAIRSWDALLIPFSIIWFAGATSWAWQVFASGASLDFKIAGVLFALVGLYFALGRFLVDAQLRSQTYYAITNRRVVVIGGFAGKDVTAFEFPATKDVSVGEASGDRATVRFGSAWPFLRWHATYWRNPEFFRTRDALTAAEMLRNAAFVR